MGNAGAERQMLSISGVERDTGLSKDTLRVWERRYGFPKPARDLHGERVYGGHELDKLRTLKRLIDRGYRPGKIIHLELDELAKLTEATTGTLDASEVPTELRPLLDLIKAHNVNELRYALAQTLATQGLQGFILQTVAPLNYQVGLAWMRGHFEVFEEHIYTETIQGLLRQAIATVPAVDTEPRVLLTTFPSEQHHLGLLMVQGLLGLNGCTCISLGTQTPIRDIALAATTHSAHVVALSFSASYPSSYILEGVLELRAKLPPNIGMWVGGANPGLPRRAIAGVRVIGKLDEVATVVREWRLERST